MTKNNNMMTRLYFPSFLFALLLMTVSCEDDFKYSGSDCWSGEFAELQNLKAHYEKELAAYYQLDRPVNADDYRNIITSTSTVSVDMQLYSDMDAIQKAAIIKSDPIHKLIWDKNSSVKKRLYEKEEAERKKVGQPSQEFKHEMRHGDYYILNPHSDFYNCLISVTSSQPFKDYLISTQTMQEVRPVNAARSILEVNAFDDEAVQYYIMLQFFYDYTFKLNRIHKVE